MFSTSRYTASRIALTSLIFLIATAIVPLTFAKPRPAQERGVGLAPDPTKPQGPQTPAGQQKKRPDLVLQTGYTYYGATGIVFSPDGKLLATCTFNSREILLWDRKTGRQLRTLTVQGGSSGGQYAMLTGVSAVAFSRDSKRLVAGSRTNAIKVWDIASGAELRSIERGKTSLMSTVLGVLFVGFTPDASRVIAVDSTVAIYDIATGSPVSSTDVGMPVGAGGSFSSLTVTPDGTQLAMIVRDSGSGKDQLKFVNLSTGQQTSGGTLPDDFDAAATYLAYTSDGQLLCAGVHYVNNDMQIKLWAPESKARAKTLMSIPSGKNVVVTFSNDARTLAIGSGNTASLWNTATGQQIRTFDVPNRYARLIPEAGVSALAFTPDDSELATSGFDTQIFLWDVKTGSRLAIFRGQANFSTAANFSGDGSRLYAGTKTIWDLQNGRGVKATSSTDAAPMGLVSPDGKTFIIRNVSDNQIKLFDMKSQQQIATLAPAEDAAVNLVEFSPDGRFIASTYRLRDDQRKAAANPQPKFDAGEMQKAMRDAAKNSKGDPTAMMKAYNDALAKAMGKSEPTIESKVKVWDAATGREVQTITVPGDNALVVVPLSKIAFSADGKFLAINRNGSSVTVWDVAAGKQVGTYGEKPATNAFGIAGMPGSDSNSVGAIAFSDDMRVMAVGGKDVTGGLDPTALMNASRQSGGKSGSKPDNEKLAQQMMASMKSTGVVRFWDLTSGKNTGTIQADSNELKVLAFSHDGKLLAGSNSANVIRIWDVSTGQELRSIKEQTSNVGSLAFDRNSNLLASTGDDGGVYLWDAKAGTLLATMVSIGDGSDWLVVTPDGLFDGSPAAWNQIMWRFGDNTFDVRPVEAFFNEFYYPGLLSDIIAGKRPAAPRDITQIDRRQPEVTLAVDGTSDRGTVSDRNVTAKITLLNAPAGARDVRLFRNGSLVKVFHGDVMNGQSSLVLNAKIPITAGENRLVAYAFNKDNVKSTDAAMTIVGADSLKRTGNLYVVAVGVNKYENSQYDLKYAVADAQAFGEEIKKQQSRLKNYARVDVIPLLDEDATKANVLAVLRRLAGDNQSQIPAALSTKLGAIDAAQPEDAVVIYYAGHGTAHGQHFYLVPRDLGYSGPRANLDEAGLKSILEHGISDIELSDAIEGLDAGQFLLVIDACNSGQALEAEEKRRGPMNSKGLAQLAYEKGMYILTAAQSYQAALEAARFGHGFLTYALIEEGLKQAKADLDPDGLIMVREWFDFATSEVPKMQEDEMQKSRGLSFGSAENGKAASVNADNVQRPRAFYRREAESKPLVVAARQ